MKLADRLFYLQQEVNQALQGCGRDLGSVQILAASKGQTPDAICSLYAAGQKAFGENYLQEALKKMVHLQTLPLEWHFIGPLQRNKTRKIAEHFAWVHSVDKAYLLSRLSEARPPHLPPLNICLEVNINQETSKRGLLPDAVFSLAEKALAFKNLRLRGLMAIPAPKNTVSDQRQVFKVLFDLNEALKKRGFLLDTLSMGMSHDFKAAIAEGATLIRIGSLLFGKREPKSP